MNNIWHGAYYCPNPHCYHLEPSDGPGRVNIKKTLWSKKSKSKKFWLYFCSECGTELRIPKEMIEE